MQWTAPRIQLHSDHWCENDNLSTGLNLFTSTAQKSISCGMAGNYTLDTISNPTTGTHRITAWITDDATGGQIAVTTCIYTVQ